MMRLCVYEVKLVEGGDTDEPRNVPFETVTSAPTISLMCRTHRLVGRSHVARGCRRLPLHAEQRPGGVRGHHHWLGAYHSERGHLHRGGLGHVVRDTCDALCQAKGAMQPVLLIWIS